MDFITRLLIKFSVSNIVNKYHSILSPVRVLHLNQNACEASSLNRVCMCACVCMRAREIVEKEFSTRFLRRFEQLFGSGTFLCIFLLLLLPHFFISLHSSHFIINCFSFLSSISILPSRSLLFLFLAMPRSPRSAPCRSIYCGTWRSGKMI